MNTRAQASLCFASRATARPSGTPGQLPGGGLSSLPRRGFSIHGDGTLSCRLASSPAGVAVMPGIIQEGVA